jgi:hypothetical protein
LPPKISALRACPARFSIVAIVAILARLAARACVAFLANTGSTVSASRAALTCWPLLRLRGYCRDNHADDSQRDKNS